MKPGVQGLTRKAGSCQLQTESDEGVAWVILELLKLRCSGDSKFSLNLKPILERKSEIRLEISFFWNQERQNRRCVPYWETSHNLSIWAGCAWKQLKKSWDLSLRQFKMVSVYGRLDTRSRKITWRNPKDLNSMFSLDHGNAPRKNSKEEQGRCKWSNTLVSNSWAVVVDDSNEKSSFVESEEKSIPVSVCVICFRQMSEANNDNRYNELKVFTTWTWGGESQKCHSRKMLRVWWRNTWPSQKWFAFRVNKRKKGCTKNS